MFIFFFFLFLAVFIVEVPSYVSGAGRSISGSGSCRSMLGEHELSNDTWKLGSVSIGKGVQNFRFGCRNWKLELWCVGSLLILRKIIFPRSWILRNSESGCRSRRIFWTEGWQRWYVTAWVSRTRSFMLQDRGGLICNTSGYLGVPTIGVARQSEGVVPKMLRRALNKWLSVI